MGKLTFIAGMAAGYVLGARAGRQRYEQILRTSAKVWNSGPVQKQVFNAKEVARTKAAPVVADMVADAARSTVRLERSFSPVERVRKSQVRRIRENLGRSCSASMIITTLGPRGIHPRLGRTGAVHD